MKKKKKKVVIIIQARMESSRLPGKVLRKVRGHPLLFYLFERVKRVNNADQIVVATTENKKDDKIVKFCKDNDVEVFRGDEENVLDRYYQAAKFFGAETIVRITADCPLIDPEVVERVIQFYLDNDFDYVGNTLIYTFPRGMDTEVFSRKALETALEKATKDSEKEHVTLFFYSHPEMFKLGNIAYYRDKSNYRLTVDTKEDFNLIKKILDLLYPSKPQFSLEDVINLLDENPKISKINSHIAQKIIEEK